jgi:hypothetical protein
MSQPVVSRPTSRSLAEAKKSYAPAAARTATPIVGPDDSKAAHAKAAPTMISGASRSCRLLQARRAAGQIRPSRRSYANMTTAAAKTRAAVSAPDRKCRRWTTVGLGSPSFGDDSRGCIGLD